MRRARWRRFWRLFYPVSKLKAASRRFQHTKVIMGATNNVDPDDGNAWMCNACRLPIFFSPFTPTPDGSGGDNNNNNNKNKNNLALHKYCADELPAKFEAHPLHPRADLVLIVNDNNERNNDEYCNRCRSICGSKFYRCPDYICDFTLDLTCALSITVVHRSHAHRLTATRGASCSFICNACGIQHRPPLGLEKREAGATWDLAYVCNICDFWIHPDCAVLPNAIVADKYHMHPLLLTYAYRDTSSGMITDIPTIVCAICDGKSDGIGWYDCFHCGYSAHIKCLMYSDPRENLKQVLLRDVQVPGLLHLPMADEHKSLMPHIMKITSTTDGASTSETRGDDDNDGGIKDNKVHEHPLIFHDHLQNDGEDVARVCNACVGLVSPSDPFYSCSRNNELSCRDFFLHDCCAHLPSTLVSSRNKECKGHSLSLISNVDTKPFNIFESSNNPRFGARYRSNGFAYFCKMCNDYTDIVSAFMPILITHDAHSSSHILRKTKREDGICSLCTMSINTSTEIAYECNNGCNFFLHGECAILPDTVSHEFDPHPLKLITPALALDPRSVEAEEDENEEEMLFCEICEQDIVYDGRCYYGCNKCKQSFHTDCIPYFDNLSKIKFGFVVRVTCHDCPLVCVRPRSVDGYRCGHCKNAIRESDKIALECAECYFRMHEECAAMKLLPKS